MKATISNTTRALVPEGHRITGAFSKGKPVPFYDDGDGEVYVFFLSCGAWLYPAGIVRASSFEDAYGICEDEFCEEAEETVEELKKEYGFRVERVKIVRDPSVTVPTDDGCKVGERHDRPSDYNPRLPEGMFLRWHEVTTPDPDAWMDHPEFQECYGFRPNGPATSDKLGHGIYQKDYNERLDGVTPELLELHSITLTTEAW